MPIPDLCFALYNLTLAVAVFVFHGICTLYKLYVNTCSVELLLTKSLWILYSSKMAYSSKHKRGITWESPTSSSSFFENDKWWVQYTVIYAVLSRLNHCNSFSHYRAIVLEKREKESQKIDRFFPAKLTVLLPMEALDNGWYGSWRPLTNLMQTFRACHLCTFHVATIFFGVMPTYGVLPYAMIKMQANSIAWVGMH